MKFFCKVAWLVAGALFASAAFAVETAPMKYAEWCSRAGDCLPLSTKDTESSVIKHDDRAGWKSTGRWLSVHSPLAEVSGTVGICRAFSTFPPFHWFGTEGGDCNHLKGLATIRGLDYEGLTFRAWLPNAHAPRWQNPCGSGVPVFVLSTGGDATYRERLVWDPVLIDELRFSGWSFDPGAPLFCAESADSRWEYPNVPPYEEPVYPTVNEWQYEDQIVYPGDRVFTKKLVGQWVVDPTTAEVCSYYECRPLDPAVIASSEVQENRSFVPYACEAGGRCLLRSECENVLYGYFHPCQPNVMEYWMRGWRVVPASGLPSNFSSAG